MSRRAGIAWLVGLAILSLQVAGFHSLRHDDAFITFRYGQNLAGGNGLVFNPGQRLMASTSPAHMLLSAVGYGLLGKAWLPSAMSALGCLGWIAQAGALLVILRRALGDRGAAFVALGIAFGAAWSHRFVALETNLVAACVLWAIAAALSSRWKTTAALVALAGLLRPDAYLVALPLGIACVLELRRAAWRPAAVGAALSAPWYGFAALYFGSVLPNSLANKYGSVDLATQAQRIATYLGENVFTARIRLEFDGLRVAAHDPGALAVMTWLVAIAGAVLLVRRQRALWVLVACPVLYLLAYLVLRAEAGFEWHLYPALLVLTALVLSAIAVAVESLPGGSAPRVLGLVVLAAIAMGLAVRTVQYARIHERAFWYGARDAVYRDVADYLVANAGADDVVAAYEVGSLAYYAELPIVDRLGLATPDPRAEFRRLGASLRWSVDLPAYFGRRRAHVVYEVNSEPILPGELALPGRERFSAVVVRRTPR